MTSPSDNEQILSLVFRPSKDGDLQSVTLAIKVVPNASRVKISGLLGDRLKMSVTAIPQGGKANDAVCKYLAKVLEISPRDVSIVSGHTQPLKLVGIAGMNESQVMNKLKPIMF